MNLAAADIGITDPDSTAFTYTMLGVTWPSRPSSAPPRGRHERLGAARRRRLRP
ncbi:MAG: hypothetical protein U1E62_08065 [Alsobacter sp.]